MFNVVITLFFLTSLYASGFIKKPTDAVAQHFPNAKISKKSVLLTKKEFANIVTLSKIKPKSKIFTYYLIEASNQKQHAVQFTTHVRSKNMTALVFIDEKGVVGDIELLAFYEPPEYQPPQKWLGTFKDKTLAEPS